MSQVNLLYTKVTISSLPMLGRASLLEKLWQARGKGRLASHHRHVIAPTGYLLPAPFEILVLRSRTVVASFTLVLSIVGVPLSRGLLLLLTLSGATCALVRRWAARRRPTFLTSFLLVVITLWDGWVSLLERLLLALLLILWIHLLISLVHVAMVIVISPRMLVISVSSRRLLAYL